MQTPTASSAVRPAWSLIGPALGWMLAVGMVSAVTGPELVTVQRDLHLSGAYGVVLAVAYVVPAALTAVPGALVGRRWPPAAAVPALLLMAIGFVLAAFAPGAAVLLASRVLTGLGAGLIAGTAWGMSGTLGEWRAPSRAVLASAAVAGLVIGLGVSTVVTEALTWRLTFLLATPGALAAMTICIGTEIVALVLRSTVSRGAGR